MGKTLVPEGWPRCALSVPMSCERLRVLILGQAQTQTAICIRSRTFQNKSLLSLALRVQMSGLFLYRSIRPCIRCGLAGGPSALLAPGLPRVDAKSACRCHFTVRLSRLVDTLHQDHRCCFNCLLFARAYCIMFRCSMAPLPFSPHGRFCTGLSRYVYLPSDAFLLSFSCHPSRLSAFSVHCLAHCYLFLLARTFHSFIAQE